MSFYTTYIFGVLVFFYLIDTWLCFIVLLKRNVTLLNIRDVSHRNHFLDLFKNYEQKWDVLTNPLSLVLPATDPMEMRSNLGTFMESCSNDKISCSSSDTVPEVLQGKGSLDRDTNKNVKKCKEILHLLLNILTMCLQ